jgi:UDP-2,3-diacylglucosamine pyrophosphatase LpxH
MRRVFIISDLHLGGRPDERDETGRITRTGFQFCNAYQQLADFVDWLRGPARHAPDESLELVINGDIVDFLAEDDFGEGLTGAQVWTFDEAQAVAKLEQIVARTRVGDRGVFDSLKDFLADGHRLTFLIGNHDLELSLPLVRRHLRAILGGDDVRLHFVYDGEAYTVGRLLVEHGNRYDPWNMINHSALRQERSMRSRGLPVDEKQRMNRYFVAPAGTNLVIHFMNRIKSRYRFVDLLKPETNAVIPLLLALEPDRRPELEEIIEVIRVARNLSEHSLETPTLPHVPGDMGNLLTPPDEEFTLDGILRQTLGTDAPLFVDAATPDTTGDMGLRQRLADAYRWVATRSVQFAEMARSASALYKLRGAAEGEDRYKKIHAALRRLNRSDRTFDPGFEEPAYFKAARDTARTGGFDVIVYGHTHLPKKVGLDEGMRGEKVYFNTGTWCDVMQLPDAFTRDFADARSEVEEFVEAVRRNDFGRYVRRYLSFVEVEVRPDGSVGDADLYSYCGAGRERAEPLANWPGGGNVS